LRTKYGSANKKLEGGDSPHPPVGVNIKEDSSLNVLSINAVIPKANTELL